MIDEELYVLDVVKYTSQKILRAMFTYKSDQTFAVKQDTPFGFYYEIHVNCNHMFGIDLAFKVFRSRMQMPEGTMIDMINSDELNDNLKATGNFKSFVSAMSILIDRLNKPHKEIYLTSSTAKKKKIEEMQGRVDLLISEEKAKQKKKEEMRGKLFKK